jgi:hypothetical protein
MDAFSYLSVLLSIIIGLAITQVLEGYRSLLLAKGRVQLHVPAMIWSGLILLFAAQAWWASFGLRARSDWNFASFAVILLQMVMLYMLAAVALPDVAPEQHVDLSRHFERHHRAFFVFLIGMLATSVVKDVVLDGRLPTPVNLAFHVLLAAIAIAGWVVRDFRAHLAIALLAVGGTLAYIALLFAHL